MIKNIIIYNLYEGFKMREMIRDIQKIEKDDTNYFYINDYKIKIDKKQALQNMTFLQNNINTLKAQLNVNITNVLKEKEKLMGIQFNISQEALKNYDKYEDELIEEIKKDRENRKGQFKQYIDDFDMLLKNNLDKLTIQLNNQIKKIKLQYDLDLQHLQLYKDVGLEVVDDVKDQENTKATKNGRKYK